MKFSDKLLKYGKVLDSHEFVDDNGDYCKGMLIEYTNGVTFFVVLVNGTVIAYG